VTRESPFSAPQVQDAAGAPRRFEDDAHMQNAGIDARREVFRVPGAVLERAFDQAFERNIGSPTW
jgi:hypothetical protein